MSKTHQLTVAFVAGQTLATWRLDGIQQQDNDSFQVQPGDKIVFEFAGPGDVAECVLISGQMQTGCHGSSPFTEGNRINLKANSTVHVGKHPGTWGFTVSFSVFNGDGTSSFYYLPDPELQVDSRSCG